MRLKGKHKICIAIVLVLLIVLSFNINSVSAAINPGYSAPYGKDEVGLENSIKSSTALDLLGHLVYSVGRIMEWILGSIFEAISGNADFPWADRIVFNGIAMLDVNFINPDSGSFLGGNSGAIATIIKNTYSTVFSIALAFFGIFAMISAIKLAISTIADQKAKYKQALVDWALGFVMLFCVHYFMSFMFYLNEQLVIVASGIASDGLASAQKIVVERESNQEQAWWEAMKDEGVSDEDIERLKKYPNLIQAWFDLGAESNKGLIKATTKGGKEFKCASITLLWMIDSSPTIASMKDSFSRVFYVDADSGAEKEGLELGEEYSAMVNSTSYGATDYWSASGFSGLKSALRSEGTFETYDMTLNYYQMALIYGSESVLWDADRVLNIFGGGVDIFKLNKDTLNRMEMLNFADDTDIVSKITSFSISTSSTIRKKDELIYLGFPSYESVGRMPMFNNITELTEELDGVDLILTDEDWTFPHLFMDAMALKAALEVDKAHMGGTAGTATVGNDTTLSSIAIFFKNNAYSAELGSKAGETTTIVSEKVNIVSAILYAILVAQSIILFISYIKRLFYVIILGIMAPVVVAYDFFKRFGR